MAPGTKKTSISLKPELVDWAEVRAAELGFENSFSAYVAWLIQRDRKANASSAEVFSEDRVEYSETLSKKRQTTSSSKPKKKVA